MQIHKVLVKDMMVKTPFTVDVHDDFAVVWDLFRLHKISHLPVVVNDRLLTGIITKIDLFRTIAPKKTEAGKLIYDVGELNRFKIKDIMTKEVATLGPDDYLGKAIDIMIKLKVGCLPIVNKTRYLEGIITRGMVLRTVSQFFT
ncbi:MAG: CBS domain-containing protein [Candidatus Omnitrophica bacterium]|nr:CBS domain-containing protein [Candidatus Omnitrophota bacterium]